MFKKILLILFVLIIGYFLISNAKAEIMINDSVFNVDLALFFDKKTKGLSGIDSIEENNGMLFVYFNNDIRYFWMKDMDFPIDILWIKGNKIINISENVPVYTDEQITRINSVYPVDRVLELKAGTILKHNIKINDKVIIKLKTPFN